MSEQVTIQVKSWGGPVIGFVGGMVKATIALGLAVETFFYGAIGAAGVLFVQEVYKFIKDKIKQTNKKNGKVDQT